MSKSIWQAVAAYVAWGLFPFYWKQVASVPALEVIAHRIFWSFVTLAVVLSWKRQWSLLRNARSVVGLYVAASALVSVNWFAYIWAVNSGFIVETSLGYFINPLVSVLLGVVFFRERLRPVQWMAVACAAAGVLYLSAAYGSLPWISLFLAFTFAGYGAVKKIAPLGPLEGLTLETSILALPALAYLVYGYSSGKGAFLHTGAATSMFLTGAGVVTTLPLVLFASAVRRVSLTMIGILQYIAPTLQLMAGVLFYKEPFKHDQLIGFAGVWIGLALFAADRAVLSRSSRKAASSA
ncbi:MAG: EamA family transporter RarD [Acidobacteriota bacterium]